MRPTPSKFTNPSGLIDKRIGNKFASVEKVADNLDAVSHLSYYLESLFNLDRNLTLLSDENVDHHILKDITIFQGPSAYELAVKNGFVGTLEEWLASLRGLAGDPGPPGIIDTLTLNGILDGIQSNTANISAANVLISQNAASFGQYITSSDLANFSLNIEGLLDDVEDGLAIQLSDVIGSIPTNQEIVTTALGVVGSALDSVTVALNDADTRINAANALLDTLRGDLEDGTTAFNNFLLQNDTTIIRLNALEALSGDHSASIIDLDFVTSELASRQIILQAESDTHSSSISSLSQVTADTATQVSVLQVKSNEDRASILNLNSVTLDLVTTTNALTLEVGDNFSYSLATRAITSTNAVSIDAIGVRTDTAESHIINLQTVTADTATNLNALTVRTDTAENSIINLQNVTSTNATQHSALAVRVGTAEGDIINLDTIKASKDALQVEANRISAVETRTTNAESGILQLQSSKADQATLTAESTRITQISSRIRSALPLGIRAGVIGNVTITPNAVISGANNGEIYFSSGTLEHPDSPTGFVDVPQAVLFTTLENAFSIPGQRPFYVVWSQTLLSARVNNNNGRYLLVFYNETADEWRYFHSNSSVTETFIPVDSDRLIAVGYKDPAQPKISHFNSLINFSDISATIQTIQSTKADRTELFDTASAIQQDRIATQTALAAALVAETGAADSFSDADSARSTAESARDVTTDLVDDALGHANAAAQANTQAQITASEIAVLASSTETSSLEAIAAVRDTLPSTFENPDAYFTNTITGRPEDAVGVLNFPETFEKVNGPEGEGLRVVGQTWVAAKGALPAEVGHTYRLFHRGQAFQAPTNEALVLVVMRKLDANYNQIGNLHHGAWVQSTALQERTINIVFTQADWDEGVRYIRPAIIANYLVPAGEEGDGDWVAYKLEFSDRTVEIEVANAAAAAANHALTAAAHEDAAGQYAETAEDAELAARTAESNALAHSNTAVNARNDVNAQAATVALNTTIVASTAEEARRATISNRPTTFEEGGRYFTINPAGLPSVTPDADSHDIINSGVDGDGYYLENNFSSSSVSIFQKQGITLIPGDSYRVSADIKQVNGIGADAYLRIRYVSGNYANQYGVAQSQIIPSVVRKSYSAVFVAAQSKFDEGARLIKAELLMNSPNGEVQRAYSINIENVTSEVKAAASAAASASSALLAQARETAAAAQALVSQNAAIEAESAFQRTLGLSGGVNNLVPGGEFKGDPQWRVVEGSSVGHWDVVDNPTEGRTLRLLDSQNSSARAVGSPAFKLTPGNRIKIGVRVRGSAGSQADGFHLRLQYKNSYGSYIGTSSAGPEISQRTGFQDFINGGQTLITNTFEDYEFEYVCPSDCEWASASVYNWTQSNSEIEVSRVWVYDIEQSHQAAVHSAAALVSANSSAQSLSDANQAVSDATEQATIATNAANSATGSAADAAVNRTSSAGSAVTAQGAAAEANAAMLLAAQIQGSAINLGSTFAEIKSSGIPEHWSTWTGPVGTVDSGLISANGYRMAVGPGVNQGISQVTPLGSILPGGYYVLTSDVVLNSGVFAGSGMLVQFRRSDFSIIISRSMSFRSTPNQTGVHHLEGLPGNRYVFEQLIQAPAESTRATVYAMSHWNAHNGGFNNPIDITYHRCSLRAATATEIASGKVSGLEASVASNASAIVTEAAQRALLSQTVNANQNQASINASAISTLEGVNNSTIVLRAQSGNSALLELVAQSSPNGSTTSARISATNILLSGSVTATSLATNSVTATKIATNAITANKIAANAVTAAKINVSSLSAISANLGTIQVGTANIANASITSAKIKNLAVDTLHIAGGAVTAETIITDNQVYNLATAKTFSANFASSGQNTRIFMSVRVQKISSPDTDSDNVYISLANFAVKRGNTTLATHTLPAWKEDGESTPYLSSSFMEIDENPPAGTHNYSVTCSGSGVRIKEVVISIQELKK